MTPQARYLLRCLPALFLLAAGPAAAPSRVDVAPPETGPGCKPLPGVTLRWEGVPPAGSTGVRHLTLVVEAAMPAERFTLDVDVPAGARAIGAVPSWDGPVAPGRPLRFDLAVEAPSSGLAVVAAHGLAVAGNGTRYRVGAAARLGPGAARPEPPVPAILPGPDGELVTWSAHPRQASDRVALRGDVHVRNAPPPDRDAAQETAVEGVFYFRDRSFGPDGFTVEDPAADRLKPIRRAEVEIVRNTVVVATGRTGEDGSFSVPVASSTGTWLARVKSRTRIGESPEIDVYDAVATRRLYAAETPMATQSASAQKIALGETVVEAGAGGEAFNILDACIDAADAVTALRGSPPPNSASVYWNIDSSIGTYYSNATRSIMLLDEEGYDDCVIIHEYGHYVDQQFSRDDSPGGPHYIDQSTQNPLLAWSEGWASFWQGAVRRQRPDDPAPSWYVDNNLDGSLLFSYECEVPGPTVSGLGSEVAVQAALWDIIDGPDDPDPEPGVDDDPLHLSLEYVWRPITGPMRTGSSITMEDFWSGWFSALIQNGFESEMRETFTALGMDFAPDAAEPDGLEGLAAPLPVDGTPVHHTFYPAPDVDYHSMDLHEGDVVTVETLDIVGYGDTYVEIYDPSLNRIAFNDNAPAFSSSYEWTGLASSVSFTAPSNGVYRARVTRASNGYGRYTANGAYTIRAVRGRPGTIPFTSIGIASGVASTALSLGAAFADYDLDGDADLLVVNNSAGGMPEDLLYRNDGHGAFTNAIVPSGISVRDGGIAAAWGDLDNDGDPDLFLTDHALFLNDGGGTFTDVTDASGITDLGREFDAAWADADGDGLLDLFVAVRNAPSALWHNNGDGTFTDVAAEAGLVFPADGGNAYGAAWGDYDGDFHPDLFVGLLADPGHALFHNRGDGTFEDVTAAAGVASPDPAVGGVWGDVTGDGLLDLFVASSFRNKLYVNDGDGTFTEEAAAWGVDEPSLSRGAGLVDYDLDGDLDLFVVNFDPQNILYENLGGRMVRTSQTALGQGLSHGTAWGDIDGDGDADVYVTRQGEGNLLFRNDLQGAEPRPHLNVTLRGVTSNRDGLGAVVTVHAGDHVERREVGTGVGWAGKSRLPELFGAPDGTAFDSLTVEWPSGERNVVELTAGTTRVTVAEDTTTTPPPVVAPLVAGRAFPNPFVAATELRFTLGEAAPVSLSVFDLRGRLVRTLLDEPLPAGDHAATWDGLDATGRAVASGVYFYRLEAGRRSVVRKLVRLAP